MTAAAAEAPRVPLSFPGEVISVPWRPGYAAGFQLGSPEERGVVAAAGSLPLTLYRPDGPGPFPFVLLLYGCTDLHFEDEWRGWVEPWAAIFRERGVGIAVVESLRPRGIDDNCANPNNGWPERRADDAYSAREWLARQAFADADRIAVIGMSNGGAAVLAALRSRSPGGDGFRAGVALYPPCQSDVDSDFEAPLLVLIGGADDITPAAACERMSRRPLPRTFELRLVVYPGAWHVFDIEWPGEVVLRSADRAARIGARREVIEFLTKHGVIPAGPPAVQKPPDG